MKAHDVRDAVAGVVGEARRLGAICDGIDGDGIPLLSTLYAVDRSITALKRVRAALLRHERQRGTSWGEISDATGVHASTWRHRFEQGAKS